MSGGSTYPTLGNSSKSGRTGTGRSRGRGQHVHFSGMNVLYDSGGHEYPVDDYKQIYVSLEAEQADAIEIEEEKFKETKN